MVPAVSLRDRVLPASFNKAIGRTISVPGGILQADAYESCTASQTHRMHQKGKF